MEKIFQIRFLIAILFFFLFISSASAIQTFEQNKSAKLCHAVRQGDGLPTGVDCNITITYSGNGSNLISFKQMDELNDKYCYNLTGTDTAVKGFYNYEVTCSNGIENDTLTSQYFVNLGGIEPSQSRTASLTRTIWTFFGLGLLFFIAFFFIKSIPFKLSILLLMIWFFLMGINTSYISIQDEVVNSSIETFFSFFLTLSFYANYFIFLTIIIIWMITFFVTILERKKRSRVKEYG